jgi:CRISPR-associated endonuclease/helicase Cas3
MTNLNPVSTPPEGSALLLQFWGKTPARPPYPPDQFHPVIYHMLDVAFVAEALLHDQAHSRLYQALAHAWSGVSRDPFFAWLPFLIATHDLGKISAAFQGQAKDARSQPQRERLEQAGIVFPPRYEKAPYHAEVSAVWLHHHLVRRESDTEPSVLWALRDAMSGHHGRFTQATMRDIARRLRASERGTHTQWEAWRDDAYTLLRHLLAPPGDLTDMGKPQSLRPATAVLTGFIILCDWIGSNSNYFPAAPDVTLENYLHMGRKCASNAIDLAGLVTNRAAPTYTSFTNLLPDISQPRPLQEAIDDLPAEMVAGPLLAVIEAPTGEGKTEAALALAWRLGACDGLDELFFALPTMATSNQMFGRLSHFYNDLYGAAVQLTHSQSAIVKDDLRRAALAGDQDAAEPLAASALAAIEWFAGSKKAMLAPFGVGTVDQVELAGLNVRHYVLRLLALAKKVVIIDEVHAYDAYMSVILEHTLTWLASLGTSVFLLSATLPATRHRALAASYVRGLGTHGAALDVPDDLPYPAISLASARGQHRATPGVFRPDQRFTLRCSKALTPEQEAQHLIDLVCEGGAVARIYNRVDDAQAMYRALCQRLPAEQRLLIHARFPLYQRDALEKQVTTWVGKATTRTPEQPMIIVGTQVLEQSLDYDVDVMVSDFAPVDLLLQRAGRLHRHGTERAGKRPDRHTQPVLEVLLPYTPDDLPDWKRWAPIYDASILWRTWEVLGVDANHDTREIVLPRDYRPLIEAVYQDSPQVPANQPYTTQMTKALKELEQSQGEMRAQARTQLTPAANLVDAITDVADLQFTEDEDGARADWKIAKTRLGDRITVVPLYRVNGELAFDPGGTDRLSLDIPPDTNDELREILKRSVPISDPRIIAAFREEERQDMRWPWGEVPAPLRFLFPLVLDPMTRATRFDNRTVYLDDDLGLVIEKENL